jgi:hypothetical protein
LALSAGLVNENHPFPVFAVTLHHVQELASKAGAKIHTYYFRKQAFFSKK